MNPSEFMKKWINGMKNLDEERMIHAKISGHIGNIIGFSMGIPIMVYFSIVLKDYKWIWTIIVLLVADYMAVLELIVARQQLMAVVNMKSEIKKLEEADKNGMV